jgi:hypothetical protein
MKYSGKSLKFVILTTILTTTIVVQAIGLINSGYADSDSQQSDDKFIKKCNKAQDSGNVEKKLQSEDQFERHTGGNALCP